ncbi:MAG TPA: OPT/YSL family transporter [Phycisphaerales bacterium]|nr:OPT/YSL family transporter [Phycisphaerales bacterium]
MAIQNLSEEQIRTWTREQKDRWWLENVYRGNMPQLTLRSALTGFLLGGVLSATNLYVGAKTGWTLGVGLTSVILAFAAYRVMARFGMRDMTILENNCSQSIATAAGYMTGPLISGIAAYMWVQNELISKWHLFWFMIVLSILGVLVAFPMKRRFINDEQQPFPEGRACGVVLDALYTGQAASGMFKAKMLSFAAILAGLMTFLASDAYLKLLRALAWIPEWMSRKGEQAIAWKDFLKGKSEILDNVWHLPHSLDTWYYNLAAKHNWPMPRLAGVELRQMGVSPALDWAMIGAGGLMGMRPAMSMMIGMVINFFLIVPWMISIGEIQPTATGGWSRSHILNSWALWWGISIMVTASMVSLFAKPQIFVEAFKGIFSRSAKAAATNDPVKHIELPLWISWVGIPVVGAIAVWMAHDWFGVKWIFGATAIPLIMVLTLIAASSTALTGITPTGSLSKIPQFLFGALDPKHPPTNLMSGVICVEVTSNASNLLMDIKPGYMLGGKPRHQAVGHIIGILSGAIASTPLFYMLFLSKYDPAAAKVDPNHVQSVMVNDAAGFGFPSAVQWKGVSDLVAAIFNTPAEGATQQTLLTTSIIISMVIAAIVGLGMELTRIFTRNKFPISPLALGLGVVVPPESTMAMFAGAAFFALMSSRYKNRPESTGHKLWVDCHEPICAGLIAGAALVGIGAVVVGVFLLP